LNGTIAPLKNVALFTELVERVMERPAHLPGMATFHGFSGYGKTFSATYAANLYKARYVEVGSSWTKKRFCEALLAEIGITPKGRTIADMVDAIIEALALDDKPLIIDEFDYVAEKGMVELVREIHDKTGAAIILIGEELLPAKLERWERFHNRILDWQAAAPADYDDVVHLARLYCNDIGIEDKLLRKIGEASQGRVRRICVNIERVREQAIATGQLSIDLKDFDGELFTGRPPRGRL
jgi:DNA transposition AAA+ family ATPase